ncbi:MAG: ribbon-helix-helix protein, CopG family [Acidimicrobiales bacterium]
MNKALSDQELDQLADRTEEDLDALAEQLEHGEPPVLRLRGGPGRPPMGDGPAEAIRVRLEPELRRALREWARAQGASESEVVRAALRSYLEAS